MGYLQAVGIRTNLTYLQYQALRGTVWEGKPPIYHMTWGSSSIKDISALTSLFFEGGRDDNCRDEKVSADMKAGDVTIEHDKRHVTPHTPHPRNAAPASWGPILPHTP